MRQPTEDEETNSTSTDDQGRPSRLAPELQLLWFKNAFTTDRTHSANWRKQAKEDFDFAAGDQWSPEDEATLKGQGRTPIVFNRTLTIIKSVAGMEINGRHEIAYLPRSTEDTAVNEVLTGASKWMADNCDGEDEESAAFQHALITGMGWNEHRLDYEEDADGRYLEEAINPLEMFWDARARKKNLTDAKRIWRVRSVPLSEAMALFPGFNREELHAAWATGNEADPATKTLEERRVRDENVSGADDRLEVTIVQVQWWEREKFWFVADQATNQKAKMTTEEYEILQKRFAEMGMPAPMAVQMNRRVYKQAFIGGRVLEVGEAPIPDRFSFTCITGEPHHNKGTWFGLVRCMRDPQMWANKWLLQSLHILNTTAKGGIVAEAGAFDDQRQAEETYARPDAITWAAKGAIKDGKIMAKPGAGFPTGHMQLMEFAVNALRDVTGINYELLGLRDVNQPGILEAQRKQAGMTVLATMFDSLRRMRKIVGRIRLYYIQNFLSDGRLVRIMGKDGNPRVIQLVRDKTVGEYDVVVDDAPTSPNQKERNWAILQPMLVAFKDQIMGNPELLLMAFEQSPLPSRFVEGMRQALNKPNPEADKAKQMREAAMIAAINKDQSVAQKNIADAAATQAESAHSMALAENLMAKNNDQVDSIREVLDMTHKAAQIDKERASAEKTRAEAFSTMHGVVAPPEVSMAPVMPEPAPEPRQEPQDGALAGLMQVQVQIAQALGQISQAVQAVGQMEQGNAQKLDALIGHLTAPTEIIRDESGRAVGVRRAVQQAYN